MALDSGRRISTLSMKPSKCKQSANPKQEGTKKELRDLRNSLIIKMVGREGFEPSKA